MTILLGTATDRATGNAYQVFVSDTSEIAREEKGDPLKFSDRFAFALEKSPGPEIVFRTRVQAKRVERVYDATRVAYKLEFVPVQGGANPVFKDVQLKKCPERGSCDYQPNNCFRFIDAFIVEVGGERIVLSANLTFQNIPEGIKEVDFVLDAAEARKQKGLKRYAVHNLAVLELHAK